MAISGIITTQGVDKSQDLANNAGFEIKPYRFAVTEQLGDFLASRDINSLEPTWYDGLISGGVKIDENTVELICNIPANSAPEPRFTREVYIIAEDESGDDFLLGLAQPTTQLVYDPDGELRLRLQFTIDNIDIGNLYNFVYTQATEINDHNQDNNAHPIIQDAIKKAGIYPQQAQRIYNGQTFDQFPVLAPAVFDGAVVYFDTINNRYANAVLDAFVAQSRPVGVYIEAADVVVKHGVVDYEHSLAPYTELFLSTAVAGTFTVSPTEVKVGHVLADNKLFVDIAIVDVDEQANPDGDRLTRLVPPVIRELTLQDENEVNWDVVISDQGILQTVPNSSRDADELFIIQRVDLSFAQIKVDTDGTLYVVSPPDDPSATIDQFYYIASPNGTAFKFTVNLSSQIVMDTFQNTYSVESETSKHFSIKQTSATHALTYYQVYDEDSLPSEPPEEAGLLPTCFYDDGTVTRPIFFDGDDWRYFSNNSVV